MAWIESHQSLERHPKTSRLMTGMGWDLDTTIGKLFRFWWWCVDYAQDGDLRRFNDAQLGAAVALNGDQASRFVEVMVEACWLDREPYFRVHDWWDYVGPFLRAKYKQSPDKWRVIQALYKRQNDNPDNNGCLNGCNTPTPTNQPTNLTNQPTAEEVASMVGVVVDRDPIREARGALNGHASSFAKNWINQYALEHAKSGNVDILAEAILKTSRERAVEVIKGILADPTVKDPFAVLKSRMRPGGSMSKSKPAHTGVTKARRY